MKKYLFSLLFILISFIGYSQKGLSYQAVILDPLKIEIPGQDISGQPLVDGDVWLKFSIYNGATLQFEEVQKTKTDAYGLVNLLIGSVSSASFNSLVWDSSQKSLQVYVSFNQGGAYTKISDQKLNYNPYAFFAETAGKIAGTIPISGGGTGATNTADALSNLGLDKVNNTSDAGKPVSSATQTALNLKANLADVTLALASKADTSFINAKMTSATISDANVSTKGKIQLAGDLGGTAEAPTVPGLALKANTSDVTTSLGLKENTSNKSAATGLGNSDQLYPTQNAVKSYVDSQVAAATIADADANTKGKIQLAGDLGGTADTPTVPGLALKANTSSLSSVATSGDYNDLTNKPSIPSAYTLPKATGSALGGVKVGANLSIDANGILSGVSSYSLPIASASELGGVKVGTGLSIINGILSTSVSGVPYTGATQAVDLGAFDLKVNGITVGRGNNGLEVNVGIGKNVLSNTITGFQGNYLTAIGFEALKNDTWGYFNTAIGSSALFSNTYGLANTAIGSNSLFNNIGANFNTAVGTDALKANTDGISNTAIGKSSGNVNTTGNQNTAIGSEANFGANNLINATAIGYNAIVTASNSVRLGNTAVSNVKTNGTITAGTVTYPNAHNSIAGQVLTTDASGVASWAQSSARSWTDQPTVSANQTTFTLTYTPPSTNKIWMFINGVRTNNNAYSVSGTTVTYVPSGNGGYIISASDRVQFDYTY